MLTVLTATEPQMKASGETVAYLDWRIRYDPKPIFSPRFDWNFWHEDYDGAPDAGDDRCGSCGSLSECMDEIAVRIEEGE